MGVKIRERDGAWWVFVNHRGSRTAKKVGTEAAAQKAAEKIQAALAVGAFIPARDDAPRFKAYAERWLPQHQQVNGIRESTAAEYQQALRCYLLPAFGDRALTAITRADVKAFVARLREGGSVRRPGTGLAPRTVQLVLATLRVLLDSAVDDGVLQHNPASRIGKWNKRQTEREAEGCDPFTSEELEAIIRAAQDVVPLWPLAGVWALTGVRAGEGFGVRWRDVDLGAGTVLIRRTLSGGREGAPKTGRTRVVNLAHPLLADPGAVLEALRALRSVREAEAAVAGRDLDPAAFVFTRPDGRPFDSRTFSSLWARCLRQAAVRHRPAETLRHTFASTLLSRGESLLYVQEQGGWANATTVLRHYARWLPREASRLQPAATPAQPSG